MLQGAQKIMRRSIRNTDACLLNWFQVSSFQQTNLNVSHSQTRTKLPLGHFKRNFYGSISLFMYCRLDEKGPNVRYPKR